MRGTNHWCEATAVWGELRYLEPTDPSRAMSHLIPLCTGRCVSLFAVLLMLLAMSTGPAVAAPLVLHGGSGVSDDDFREAIRLGISKVNIYTHLADAALETVRAQLADPDLKHFFQLQYASGQAIKGVVEHYMDVFGSGGKAGGLDVVE